MFEMDRHAESVTLQKTEDLLDEYVHVRDDCLNIMDAADRLDVSFSKLDMALYRARGRGDSRGDAPSHQRGRALAQGKPFGRSHGHVGSNHACGVCGTEDRDKPMCFRGDPWCSDNHRKQVTGSPN